MWVRVWQAWMRYLISRQPTIIRLLQMLPGGCMICTACWLLCSSLSCRIFSHTKNQTIFVNQTPFRRACDKNENRCNEHRCAQNMVGKLYHDTHKQNLNWDVTPPPHSFEQGPQPLHSVHSSVDWLCSPYMESRESQVLWSSAATLY